MERARSSADPEYSAKVWAAIERLACTSRPFSADDIRAITGDAPEGRHNIVGAIVNAAQKQCLIRHVGYTRSARVVGHANRVSLWQGES
jgi:hypothetical protein